MLRLAASALGVYGGGKVDVLFHVRRNIFVHDGRDSAVDSSALVGVVVVVFIE